MFILVFYCLIPLALNCCISIMPFVCDFLAVQYSYLVLPFSAYSVSLSLPTCSSQPLLSSCFAFNVSVFHFDSSRSLLFLLSDFVLRILSWIICRLSIAFQVSSVVVTGYICTMVHPCVFYGSPPLFADHHVLNLILRSSVM